MTGQMVMFDPDDDPPAVVASEEAEGFDFDAFDADRQATCYRCREDIRPVPPEDQYMQGGPWVGRDGWPWCGNWNEHAPAPNPDAKPGEWAVHVDGMRIYHCTGDPATGEWWFRQEYALRTSGQLHLIRSGVGGDICWLGPYDWENAEFMRRHMVDKGVPKGAVKLIRPPRR